MRERRERVMNMHDADTLGRRTAINESIPLIDRIKGVGKEGRNRIRKGVMLQLHTSLGIKTRSELNG